MIEYREATGGAEASDGKLTGLVTPFGVETTIGDLNHGGFRERIMPGAFKKTLQERDVVLVHSHDTSKPLARTSITEGPGSLSLSEDPEAGLRMEATPVQTSYGKDVLALTDAKVLRGMSFGFEPIKDAWYDDNGRPSTSKAGTRRDVHEVRLHEVTTTAFPAYPTTTLDARDTVNAARGVEEARAAKATYADLETCGECGSTNEYGAYCSACGEPMGTSQPSGDFCTSCGSPVDDSSRSSHVCKETRADADAGEAQGVASIDAILDESLKLLDSCDRNSLPPEVNQAIDLLHGASKNLDAHMKAAGIPDPDESGNKNEYDSSSDGERSEPARTTPEIDGEALRAYYRAAYDV